MKQDVRLKQEVRQENRITQSMIQRLAILQMGIQEIDEYLGELYLENPFVEIVDPVKKEEAELRAEWETGREETGERSPDEENPGNRYENIGGNTGSTFTDSLHMQLLSMPLSEEERRICEFIIQYGLDEKGYFTESEEVYASLAGTEPPIFRECLETIKTLEPAGTGASGLEECLILQLQKKGFTEESTEIRIVREYLELLAGNRLAKIAKLCGVSQEEAADAAERIRGLNPIPSAGYAGKELDSYLVPDLMIMENDGQLYGTVNTNIPQLHVNKEYVELIRSSDTSPQTAVYITGKIREIEAAQKNLENRVRMLQKTGEILLEKQRRFFTCGEGNLAPMTLRDMASELGVSISTVSRLVNRKYLQCRFGMFRLSYFFSRGLPAGGEGEKISAVEIRKRICALIEAEDKKRPLSDQKLCDILQEGGIDIQRRTVAKYRELLGLPDCRGRKKYT